MKNKIVYPFRTVRFYLRVIKNYKPAKNGTVSEVIFKTQQYEINEAELAEFLKRFKSTIRKDCDIHLFPVKIKHGLDISSTSLSKLIKQASAL